MSYTRTLYHIIFRTKYSVPAIDIAYEDELYRYIWGFVKNKESILYRINGMPDHLHLFIELSPKFALADFMRDLKCSTSKWLQANPHFPLFQGWATGYAAFTYSQNEKEVVINYIKRQKEHHLSVNLETELRNLLTENGCEIDEKFIMQDND